MTVTFTGPDEEFAAATGSNVNVTSTTSRFDNPPNAFSNLTITSNPGDTEPYLFEEGDTYDVSWDGFGGGGNIEDATVVRTDVLPGGAGIVVLEGINTVNGEVVQIIWTPGFDLEQWYWDNYNPSVEPQFYVVDTDATQSYGYICLAAETLIETPRGAVGLERLRPGDKVLTLDGAAAPISWIGRRQVPGIGPNAPVLFAPGSIGNRRPLRLSGQHRVLLAHPLAELMYDSSEVLVPAKSLVNGNSIRWAPCPQVTWMNLTTPAHTLIRAEGAPVETLWLGEVARNVLGEAGQIIANYPELANAGQPDQLSVRPMLRHQEALQLLSLIHGRDLRPVRQLTLL